MSQDLTNYVRTIRRQLHQIPELGFDLPETSALIRDELTRLGYDPISVAGTGWIAVLPGQSGEAIAFRADMDGLTVTEATAAEFQSRHPGRMHACGHDGHMALLLGFARELKRLPQPAVTVILIFQPAEEGPGGARVIVESGILGELKVRAIYGIHLYPGLDQGTLGICSGPFMARNGEFDIAITGQSAHGGQPHLGRDALAAGAALVGNLQTIGSRNLDPLSPFVVNIGTFQAGEARNIVAGQARLTGTIRSFDRETYGRIKGKLADMTQGIGQSYGVEAELVIRDFYPEVHNDPDLTEALLKLTEDLPRQMLKPVMLAEDFAFYQEAIPGVFLFLGTGNPDLGYTAPLHSARFNFDEAVLLQGIELYCRILWNA